MTKPLEVVGFVAAFPPILRLSQRRLGDRGGGRRGGLVEWGGGRLGGGGLVALVGKGSSEDDVGLVGDGVKVLSWSPLPDVGGRSAVEEWEGLLGSCFGGRAFCRALGALVVFLVFFLVVDLWR